MKLNGLLVFSLIKKVKGKADVAESTKEIELMKWNSAALEGWAPAITHYFISLINPSNKEIKRLMDWRD